MNPWPMVIADLKALRWTALAIVTLVAMAVAVGVTVNAQERGLRKSSAVAADDFDLLIGAPGSQTQLMLNAVFLQPEAFPLLDANVLRRIAADKRVRSFSPLAMGDIVQGYPIVGTTATFALRWGRLTPLEGRVFEKRGEAIVGANVALKLGQSVTPSHMVTGHSRPFGVAYPDEVEHQHEGIVYTIVGRLPRLRSPWDNAILVPVESVWETHGLESHEHGSSEGHDSAIGQFQSDDPVFGVPMIVVRPASVADAYTLRSTYRTGGTMAFFPAEVLVSLYGVMGDMRDVLVAFSVLNTVLIFSAVLLLLWAVAGLRRKRYAVLRALGAPRRYILLLVWLNAIILLGVGCLVGLVLGYGLVVLVSRLVASATGLQAGIIVHSEDLRMIIGLIAFGSVMSLIPAWLSCRAPVIEGLRGGN